VFTAISQRLRGTTFWLSRTSTARRRWSPSAWPRPAAQARASD